MTFDEMTPDPAQEPSAPETLNETKPETTSPETTSNESATTADASSDKTSDAAAEVSTPEQDAAVSDSGSQASEVTDDPNGTASQVSPTGETGTDETSQVLGEPIRPSWIELPENPQHTTPDGQVWTIMQSDPDQYLKAVLPDLTEYENDFDETLDEFKASLDAAYPATAIDPATGEVKADQLERGVEGGEAPDEVPPVVEDVPQTVVHLVWSEARKVANQIAQWCTNNGVGFLQDDYDKFIKLTHDGSAELPTFITDLKKPEEEAASE